MERVWEEYTCGSDEVIVAVVDLGVDLDHEDLAANSIPAGSGGSRNFMSGGGTYDVEGGDHGTHIAGVISAVNNNGVGISGIAGGDAGKGIKGVRILSCQVGEGDIIETLAAVDAIRYAADNGALIAQNSWGDNYDLDGDGRISAAELERASNAEISSYEKAAVDYFIDYAGCDNFGNQLPDSPMKGDYSSVDETLLSYIVVTVDVGSRLLTARECLWNPDGAAGIRWGASCTVAL